MSKSIRRFLSFLLVLQLVIPYSIFAAAVGEFSSVAGNVTQTRAKEVITPIVKSPIEMKDLIVTARSASATMIFSDDSTIRLYENTKLEIKEFLFKDKSRTAFFSLATGKLQANVKKYIGGGNVFEVRSPTALAGVRGTGFEYEEAVNAQNQGVATISCTEGSLDLSALSATGEIISKAVLEAGQVAIIMGGVITISKIAAAMAAGIASSSKAGTAGAAGGAGTGTGGTAAASGGTAATAGGGTTTATAASSGTAAAAGGATSGTATAATAGTATVATAGTTAAATGLSTTAIAAGIAGGAAVVGVAAAAGGGGGGGSSSSGGGTTTTTTTPTTTDYSRYSGNWIATGVCTAQSGGACCGCGNTAAVPIQLVADSAGNASFTIPNDCSQVYSGSFNGNVLTMTSSNGTWHCNGVLYCNGTGTARLTFSDTNNATGSATESNAQLGCQNSVNLTLSR